MTRKKKAKETPAKRPPGRPRGAPTTLLRVPESTLPALRMLSGVVSLEIGKGLTMGEAAVVAVEEALKRRGVKIPATKKGVNRG